MAANYDFILEQALQLTAQERSHIANRLIESIDAGAEEEISLPWQSEIEQRMESVRQGSAKLLPHTDVMASIRSRFNSRRTTDIKS